MSREDLKSKIEERVRTSERLTVDEIKAAREIPLEEVYLESLGRAILIRPVTRATATRIGREIIFTNEAGQKDVNTDAFDRKLVMATVVSPTLTPDLVETIWTTWENQAVMELIRVCKQANGLLEEEKEAMKKAENSFPAE